VSAVQKRRKVKMEMQITQYGFIWKNATIERTMSDEKFGVLLTISTKQQTMEVRVTMGGKIKVNRHFKNTRGEAILCHE